MTNSMGQMAQMFQMFNSAQNPMGMMQQMLSGNPMFQQAMQMIQGKNPAQISSVIQNVAKQKNIPMQQLQQMASQFNLKI